MRRKASHAHRPRKPRKARAARPKAARARKPARTPPFRAHKGRGAGRVFRAHKGRHVSVFKAHGKRRIHMHGAVAHKLRAAHARRAKMRRVRMRKAHLNLALIARR